MNAWPGVSEPDDLLADRLVLDRRDEVLDDGQRDVGLEQREPHLAQRVLDVVVGQARLRRAVVLTTRDRRSVRLSNMEFLRAARRGARRHAVNSSRRAIGARCRAKPADSTSHVAGTMPF